MFRKIRRSERQILSDEKVTAILEKCTSGVLSLLGDNGYAYGVPMSYVYKDNKIYFHCAKEGFKIDSIKKHDKVSFTVIEADDIKPEEFTSYYRSVIAFGKIVFADDPDEKYLALRLLSEKYFPDHLEASEVSIRDSFSAVQILVLEIEHVTGKQASELATEAQ